MAQTYSGTASSVNAHKFREYAVEIFHGLTTFTDPLSKSSNVTSRGNRRSITKFSPRSRSNLLKSIFSPVLFPSLFITLTYPNYYPADSKDWKRHLDNFRHMLMIRFPKAWFIWKLEPQKRGAPHFHLLGDLGCKPNIYIFRRYIAELWFAVCDTKDENHLLAGTQADYISDSEGRMRAYVSKYIGKVDLTDYEEWSHPGRFWGKIGRKNFPEILSKKIILPRNKFYLVKRLVRRWLKGQSLNSMRFAKRLRYLPSFTLYISSAVIERLLAPVVSRLPDALPFSPPAPGLPLPIFD